MKLLIGSIVFLALLLILFFGGMLSNQPTLLMCSSMGLCLVGNPLVWVASYRVLTGGAGGRLAWVPAEPGQRKVTHKSTSMRSIGGEL